MSHGTSISRTMATLINMNIMIGAGVFINTIILAQVAGRWGALTYSIVGLMLIPLVVCMMRLIYIHNGGSFLVYGSQAHPLIGRLSQLCYFVSKLASCALIVQVCAHFLRTIFPALQQIPHAFLTAILIGLFVLFNALHMRVGKAIQVQFLILKLIPIFITIGYAVWHTQYPLPNKLMSMDQLNFDNMFTAIPFVLYAFTGFEATCSISRSMVNAQTNGPRAIITSYLTCIMIVSSFQWGLTYLLGPKLATLSSYTLLFPTLLTEIGIPHATLLMQIGIAASCLGAAYGIMFSNAWNLFTLAQQAPSNRLTTHLTSLNCFHTPAWCIIAEGAIVSFFAYFFYNNQSALQQINSWGVMLTYLMSAIGLYAYERKNTGVHLNTYGAFIITTLFLTSSAHTAYRYGSTPLMVFALVVGALSLVLYGLKEGNKVRSI